MIRDGAPHGDLLRTTVGKIMLRLSVAPEMEIPFHIWILLLEERAELRRIDAGHGVMRVEFHACELAEMVDALTVFPATHCDVIAFRRLKRFQPLNCFLNLIEAAKQGFFYKRHVLYPPLKT